MALYEYAGPGPHDDGQGGLVRPGDVWEWPEEPTWGPWEPVDGGSESDSAAPATQSPTGGTDSQGAASGAAPGSDSAPAATTGTEG